MKWFQVTTEEEAQALRPHYLNTDGTLLRPKIGDRVSVAAGLAVVTDWPDYPESERLTFDECMAIVRDEVTVEVMRELGGHGNFLNIGMRWQLYIHSATEIELQQIEGQVVTSQIVPNMTANKLRILVSILKGEKI